MSVGDGYFISTDWLPLNSLVCRSRPPMSLARAVHSSMTCGSPLGLAAVVAGPVHVTGIFVNCIRWIAAGKLTVLAM